MPAILNTKYGTVFLDSKLQWRSEDPGLSLLAEMYVAPEFSEADGDPRAYLLGKLKEKLGGTIVVYGDARKVAPFGAITKQLRKSTSATVDIRDGDGDGKIYDGTKNERAASTAVADRDVGTEDKSELSKAVEQARTTGRSMAGDTKLFVSDRYRGRYPSDFDDKLAEDWIGKIKAIDIGGHIKEIRMDSPSTFEWNYGANSPAAYDVDERALMINYDLVSKGIGFDKGWVSSDDPDHFIYHEVAHALHGEEARKFKGAKFGADEKLVAKSVSNYAETQPLEFVAEVFAGVAAGREFGPTVMAMYEKYSGPTLRQPHKAIKKSMRADQRDGDGDGKIYDGTPQERAATGKAAVAAKPTGKPEGKAKLTPADVGDYKPSKNFKDMSNEELEDAMVEAGFREDINSDGKGTREAFFHANDMFGRISDEMASRDGYEPDGKVLRNRLDAKMIDFLGGKETVLAAGERVIRSLVMEPKIGNINEKISDAAKFMKMADEESVDRVLKSIVGEMDEDAGSVSDEQILAFQNRATRMSNDSDINDEVESILQKRQMDAMKSVEGMEFTQARGKMRDMMRAGNVRQAEFIRDNTLNRMADNYEGVYPVKIEIANDNPNGFGVELLVNEKDKQGKIMELSGMFVDDGGDGVPNASDSDRMKTKKNVSIQIGKMLEASDESLNAFVEEFEVRNVFPDGTTVDREAAVASNILNQWAHSSGDSEPKSIAMQHAIADEFGLDSSQIGGAEFHKEKEGKQLYEKHKEVMGAVVRAMYEHTQYELKEAGIESITLFRGMSVKLRESHGEDFGAHDAADLFFGAANNEENAEIDGAAAWVVDVDLAANPISSYSTSARVAVAFAQSVTTDGSGGIIATVVDAKDVFSTFATGLGCMSEGEFVVLGRSRQGKVLISGNLDAIDNNRRMIRTIKKSKSHESVRGA